ncbi:MAG: group II intron reverse transcriptase/maturase [SAR324 cluster bacterium]|nr:group II intron reverse transcriptase/maturase [SAR324 cluster bacterium]
MKAEQEGRHNKVKALQWILSNSFSAKAIAVKRVTENKGKRTAGVDHILWSTSESKGQAIKSLSKKRYKPSPLKRIYIEKSNGKLRSLSIPTMKDRAMQALYLLGLEPVSENRADPNSYGFRSERSTHDAIEQCFNALATRLSATWVLEADIQGCFDNISKSWLEENIPMDKTILHKWLECGILENNSFIPTDRGTPQGGIISPCLMNLTLDGLEREIRKLSSRNNPEKLNFVRYADDWIITGNDKEVLENRVKPIAEKFLAERGLRLSPEKTRIVHMSQGFDFLGQNIRKYGDKLLITPSKKNIKTFLDKVRTTIRDNKGAKQEVLIRLLNPMIRGWANYHRCVVAKRIFSEVDTEIWKALGQWENRRHPHKNVHWIRQKYRRRIGNLGNVFSCYTEEGKLLTLFNASSIPIQRHVKIKGDANPFASEWDSYFEKRGAWKIQKNLSGQKRLLAVWHRQHGKCPVCSRLLTEREEFEVHHILPRSQGGTNLSSNLALLHSNCHNQVHHPLSNVVLSAEPAYQGLSGLL